MSEQPEALRLASLLENKLGGTADDDIEQAAAELRRLHAENEALKSVMVAAAEEISSHWDAHCDSEGYGPVNLMRRLEQGIPSQYGYTAGEFERLRALNAAYAAGIAAERDAATELRRLHAPHSPKRRGAMTNNDIIRMAREAGVRLASISDPINPRNVYEHELERFAALVAAAEREACARVCEGQGVGRRALEHYAALTYSGAAHDCAAAIRARGEG